MDRIVERRVRQWTRRSERAIPYGPFARLSDWLCAGRDARKGIPALPEDPAAAGDEPLGTQRMLLLGHIGRGRMEKEWIRYKAEVADLVTRLADLRARRRVLTDELSAAEERLSQAPLRPSEADLTVRIGGEQHTDVAVVRDRRRREFAAQRAESEAAVRRIHGELETTEVEIARVGEPIRIRFEVAQTRAALIDAYVRRRCAAYLARLIRKHRDGRRLNGWLRPDFPELPAWTTGPRSPDLDDLPTSVRPGRADPRAPGEPATPPGGPQPGRQMPDPDQRTEPSSGGDGGPASEPGSGGQPAYQGTEGSG